MRCSFCNHHLGACRLTNPFTPATTIDEVIAQLDQVIEDCIETRSRLGYFAALYRNVTVRVRDAIAAGEFEDGARMERLDVIFANRYLGELAKYWNGYTSTRSWGVAFHAAHRQRPIILQHLLLGMNAHINLDLAIAAIETSPGAQLPGLEQDFRYITLLLQNMIDRIQDRIEQVSPWIGLIDRVGGRTDEQICAFGIKAARDLAWRTAVRLAAATPHEFEQEIDEHDRVVAGLGLAIRSPGVLLNTALLGIRARETQPVAAVIRALKM
jgi:hypothetical protein